MVCLYLQKSLTFDTHPPFGSYNELNNLAFSSPFLSPCLSVCHLFLVVVDNAAGIFLTLTHCESSEAGFKLISSSPFIFFKLFLVIHASSIQIECFLKIGNSNALNNCSFVIHTASSPGESAIHNRFILILSKSIESFCLINKVFLDIISGLLTNQS